MCAYTMPEMQREKAFFRPMAIAGLCPGWVERWARMVRLRASMKRGAGEQASGCEGIHKVDKLCSIDLYCNTSSTIRVVAKVADVEASSKSKTRKLNCVGGSAQLSSIKR